MKGRIDESLMCEATLPRGGRCRNAATHVWRGTHCCRWHGDPDRRDRALKNHPRYRWTPERLERLCLLTERGYSDHEIARQMGVTFHAIHETRERHNLPRRRQLVLTAHVVAAMLGKKCSKSVIRWIEDGWLRGRRGFHQGPNQTWLVTWNALEAFVRDERYWPAWDPAKVTNRELLRVADRPALRYLTHAEVAAACGVERQTVNNWIRKGWLRAVRYGNWQVREDWLAEFRAHWTYGDGYRRNAA